MIKVTHEITKSFVSESELNAVFSDVEKAHQTLVNGTGPGKDFLGWTTLPRDYDRDELERIKAAAARIRKDSEVLLVIGIGGSYLGARAAVEFIKSPFYNQQKKTTPDVLFVGNNLSPDYIHSIFELIKDRDFSINVISKSGTTTEPAIAFRLFRDEIEKRYGAAGAARRIYATTDRSRGVLKQVATAQGYETFAVPDNIGGRYSVLTAVGLLPCAVAGLDVDMMFAGAEEAMDVCYKEGASNPAWIYAAARNALYRKGYCIEVLGCYEPGFRFMSEWWKQLYGESEGKDRKGIFPASVELTADLHSMGQYLQDGERKLMETIVTFDRPMRDITIPSQAEDGDGLNFLAGQGLHSINTQAFKGTMLAHMDGGVPNIEISCAAPDERTLGQLVYFFEFACGVSGYTLGVNPFDQPGVEAYKVNMFALLGKKGYEEKREELLKRLG
ncbi:MAG: glucose-6-phosphate isomerase [Oscillospiraceae bacterium]|nr:glucose-6-phosphate isomerase [Oscillospiraceae bacterium]